MRYISTRGKAPSLNFEQALLTGLAADGGLYLPETIPTFDKKTIRTWQNLSYTELAFQVISPFVGDCIDADELGQMIEASYAEFRHKAIAPLVQIDHNRWVMELFHGPTLAFKDFALQLLGRLLDYVLAKRDEHAVILGATSGDTGSAAIEGCKHCKNADIFIMHPDNKISEVQRRQMTTNLASNVHNIAIEGNFDDCQALVKACFAEGSIKKESRLVAVNSINWARIMAQVVYYFYAACALGAPDRGIRFAVPTGNFGNLFAGYMAKRMGLPIDGFCLATNANDILHRFFSANDYRKEQLQSTLSPSMDIMVSSNFERFLYELHQREAGVIDHMMADFAKSGKLNVSEPLWKKAQELFCSGQVSDAQTVQKMRSLYSESGYLADPHTAIAIQAAENAYPSELGPTVILATAHPAKFPTALNQAELEQDLPAQLEGIYQREERLVKLPNQLSALQDLIKAHRNL